MSSRLDVIPFFVLRFVTLEETKLVQFHSLGQARRGSKCQLANMVGPHDRMNHRTIELLAAPQLSNVAYNMLKLQ